MNPRSISSVALDIKVTWRPSRYFHARLIAEPDIVAMLALDTIDEPLAREVITSFLSHAGSWHGPEARRLKDELKEIIGIKPVPNGQKRKRDDGVLLTIKVPGGTIEIG